MKYTTYIQTRVACLATLFLFISMPCLAQVRALDSLDKLIGKAQTDTARINLQIKKIWLISNMNLDSAINFGLQTVEQSIAANYPKGEANARAKVGSYYSMIGKFNLALPQLKMAESIYTQSKDLQGLGTIYCMGYAVYYGVQSKYDSANPMVLKGLKIAEMLKDSTTLVSGWENLAIGYYMQSDYYPAIDYLQRAIPWYERNHDEDGLASLHLNLANAYSGVADTARAKQSFYRSIEAAINAQNKVPELYSYKNLATLYSNAGELDSTYYFAMKAADLASTLGDHGIESAALSVAASVKAKGKDYKTALELNTKALALADSSGSAYNIYQAYASMGDVYNGMGEPNKAIPYFEKAFSKLGNTDIFASDVAQNYRTLANAYELTGNFPASLKAMKQYAFINDSVHKQDNIRKSTEAAMNFDFARKEQQAQAEQLRKNERRNAQQLALIIGLTSTLILAIIAFVAFRNKQKANTSLNRQKAEIESTLSQLRSTQDQLVQAEKMASLGELTAGIAHEIQNPLNFVNNFSELNLELIGELKDELQKGETQNAIALASDLAANEEKINHHGKRADGIVKGMLQHSRSNSGVKEPTNINALADEYLRLAYHGLRAQDKSFNANLITDFDPAVGNVAVIPQDLGRVLLNLVNNAFYAVNEKKQVDGQSFDPAVSVSTKRLHGNIIIRVADNGNGIPAKVLEKIFQPFFTTKPTGKGTGLGLSMSYDIITKGHQGTLRVNTAEGKGSEFLIELPA